MTSVLLIDDEPLASDLVAEYLEKYPDFEVIGRCLNGFEGFKAIQEKKPDLVFLDVQMPKINGFEMLEMLDEPPAIIFTTAFDEYALKAFEANAIDYLLKPFSEERLTDALEKFSTRKTETKPETLKALAEVPNLQNTNRVVVKDGGKIRIIGMREIIHIEADGDYVTLFTEQGRFTQKRSLQRYEQQLSANLFTRVHRSHLVNISYIQRIDPYGKNNHLAQLKEGTKIPVSRTGYQRLKQLLNI
jgi:two-component system LytT family response regulator